VPAEGIYALLGFNALFYLNILLSVALFLTVLLTLSRWYRDSEMVVWMSSGQSLTAVLWPILWFAAPFLVAIVALSLYLSPWAEQRKLEYERQLESRDEIALISPGLFHEFRRANVVVFVESINSLDGTIHNIFLHSVENGRDVVTVARSGMLEQSDNGDRFIVLQQGRRYEGEPGTSDYRIVEFERLGRRIEPAQLRALPVSTKAIPTPALAMLDGNVERAELFWRLSVPLAALMLTLLAVPLAQVNPRMGRSFNLLSAAFLYMLYNNCMNIVQSMIAQGKLDFWVGLAIPHAIALALVLLMFGRQLRPFGLVRRAPARAAAS
jgi:lipopolysaccharide export system permease protein